MAAETERMFPILQAHKREELAREKELGCPCSFPWRLVEPHCAQAVRNHGQSLGELAARGGLSPAELVAVLEDRTYRRMTIESATAALLKLLRGGT